jgi:hypothetical protein
MTKELQASRTLVKSPPELWAECSDAAALERHLDGCFGEIRITRLQPESAVAWEGESACGTVQIEPSGWGTKVTLTAQVQDGSEPEEEPCRPPQPKSGFLVRLRARWRAVPGAVEAPVPPDPTPSSDPDPLLSALDSLGQAHHRPFSRA